MVELTYGVRPTVPCFVMRPKRGQSFRYEKTCDTCGVSFIAARPQVMSCSAACRKRKSRIKEVKRKQEAEVKAKTAKKRKKTPAKKARAKKISS